MEAAVCKQADDTPWPIGSYSALHGNIEHRASSIYAGETRICKLYIECKGTRLSTGEESIICDMLQ